MFPACKTLVDFGFGHCYKKVNIWMCSAEWDIQMLRCGGL